MELESTIELMMSDDWKDRFIAEYLQTKTRYEKLKAVNNRNEIENRISANLPPVFVTNETNAEDAARDRTRKQLLFEQQKAMDELLHILELRAELEGIKL